MEAKKKIFLRQEIFVFQDKKYNMEYGMIKKVNLVKLAITKLQGRIYQH